MLASLAAYAESHMVLALAIPKEKALSCLSKKQTISFE